MVNIVVMVVRYNYAGMASLSYPLCTETMGALSPPALLVSVVKEPSVMAAGSVIMM